MKILDYLNINRVFIIYILHKLKTKIIVFKRIHLFYLYIDGKFFNHN